jgi:hypothetical protein
MYHRLRHTEAYLSQAVYSEMHRISRVHELRGHNAARHDNHTLGEPLTTLREPVGKPHESIKWMAHNIPAISLTHDSIVDGHRAMGGRQVNSPPVCSWRTKHNPTIPGVVGNNRENLGRKLRVVSVPIIDQLKGCHHSANGRSDLVAAIGRLGDWQIRVQAHGDFTLNAQAPIVGALYGAGRLLYRLSQNGARDGFLEANQALHDRRGQRNLVPGDRAMGSRQERVERLLHSVCFVHSARGTRYWKRAKGLMGAVLLKQEPGGLCNPIVVRHDIPPARLIEGDLMRL